MKKQLKKVPNLAQKRKPFQSADVLECIKLAINQMGINYYLDERKKGYRAKWLHTIATEDQLRFIRSLSPHIVKAENVHTIIFDHNYWSVCVWFDCRPSEIEL